MGNAHVCTDLASSQSCRGAKSLGREVGYASLCPAPRDALGKRAERAFYIEWCQCGCRMLADSQGTYSILFR